MGKDILSQRQLLVFLFTAMLAPLAGSLPGQIASLAGEGAWAAPLVALPVILLWCYMLKVLFPAKEKNQNLMQLYQAVLGNWLGGAVILAYLAWGMFLLMGGALSGVIGFIGILNFINAVITSVISRKREFAVLQAVGMTGRQLKRMLITEGCLYGISAILAALAISLAVMPLLSDVLSGMFWFYTHHTTVVPILAVTPAFLLFSILIPLAACRAMARESVVERIREAE